MKGTGSIEPVALDAAKILATWHAYAPNYDRALASRDIRAYLQELNARDTAPIPWREALAYLRAAFPEFFRADAYRWCDDPASYEFSNEAAYQIRALASAIGLQIAEQHGTEGPVLDRIVVRSTYLAKFNEVTPHTVPVDGIDFIVCPLGWTEFVHRFFAGFAVRWAANMSGDDEWRVACVPHWLGIAANLVASSANQTDYLVSTMIEQVVAGTHEFATAYAHYETVPRTAMSEDLAYAAHEFALCHEVAHIAARDFEHPDEARADWRGWLAYVGTWQYRVATNEDLITTGLLRAGIAPIAFLCAVCALVAARGMIAKHLGIGMTPEQSGVTLNAIESTSRRLVTMLEVLQPAFDQVVAQADTPEELKRRLDDRQRINKLFAALVEYEIATIEFLHKVSPDACVRGASVARAAEAHMLAKR